MACPAQDITDTELAILHALWNQGAMTTRQLSNTLYPRGTPSHYATVQSLLARLEKKSLVVRKRGEPAQIFEARVPREQVIRRRLRELAEKLCGGSLSPLLTHLVRETKLTQKDRGELRALLDELDRVPKRRARVQGRRHPWK